MSDTKISALAAVTDVLDTDEFVLARSGATKKIDGVDLRSEVGGFPTLQAYISAMASSTDWLVDVFEGVVASGGGTADPMMKLATLATGTVEVGAGGVLVSSLTDPGRSWFWYFPTAQNVFSQFAAADPTNPRRDLIVAQVVDAVTGEAELQVLEGVPAVDPDPPATPADAVRLWEILVPANQNDAAFWTPTDRRDRITLIPDFSSYITAVQEDIALLQGDLTSEHASADHEVTNTTLQAHAELGAGCAAGFQWHFRFHVFLLNDGAAEGVKFALTGTVGLGQFGITAQVTIYDDTLDIIAGTGRITALDSALGASLSAGVNHAVIEGVADVNVGGTTGTLGLAFAQNAAGANAGVHVQINSSAIVTRLASSS